MKEKQGRSKAMIVLRAAALTAALLALAKASAPLPTRARTVVALIDASDSVGPEEAEASRASALSLFKSLASEDRAASIVFAGAPTVLAGPLPPQQAIAALEAASLEARQSGATDLSAAIAAGNELAALGPGRHYLYLFSDGRASSGRGLFDSSPKASSKSAAVVYALPSGKRGADALSLGLSAPESAHPGERVVLDWKIESLTARNLQYQLRVDGKLVERGSARLEKGSNELPISVDAGSAGRREVLVEELREDGSSPEEMRAGAYVAVGGAARVLVVSRDEVKGRSPLAAALGTQGMATTAGGTEALPDSEAGFANYSAVVLDDIPALEITEGQQSALRDYVAAGGGLLVVGGESSLGRGEYYATLLEDMLPVSTDFRQRLMFTRAKLLFVIDHSGSMSDTVGTMTKQMAAMKGVAASIPLLNPLDEVGIIGFDSTPAWVLPFTPAREREKILGSLSHLGDGGGTDLEAALEEVLRGFGEQGPTKRHAIVLTDGQTGEADFPGLCARLAAANISVTTIGIGQDVNEPLLKDIAARCEGKYYRASFDQVPTVIDKETARMTRDLIQEGHIETRVAARGTASGGAAAPAVSEGLGDPPPPIEGYLLTKAKSLATVILEAANPQTKGNWDPLLSTWRYGNGKVSVFASDSGKRWLSPWSGKAAYNRLWSQAIRSIERASPSEGLHARAVVDGGNARVIVEAMGPDRRSQSSLRLVGKAETGAAFALEEVAPGRYEGSVPLGGAGLRSFDVLDPASGSWSSAWVWAGGGAEAGGLGPDLAALSLIASSSGGKLLQRGAVLPPEARVSWSWTTLRLPLLVASLACLLAELYLRSTMTGQLERAKAAIVSRIASQRQLAEQARKRPWPERPANPRYQTDEQYSEMRRELARRVAQRSEAARQEAGHDS